MRFSGKNLGLGLAAVAAFALLLAWGFRDPPVLVDAASVQVAPLAVTVEEEGRTRVIDRYVVSAPVAGFARRVPWEVGDAVERGETLVHLEPLPSQALDPRSRAEAEAKVAAARAALHQTQETVSAAKAEADLAKIEHERKKRLCKDACVSEEELDQAEARARRTHADLRSARFAVEVARFELEEARTALRQFSTAPSQQEPETLAIAAPVDGQVLKLYHESEGVVQAGDALVELGDAAALEVVVDVLSADAVRLRPGMQVFLRQWGGEQDLEGVVRKVEPVGFTKVSALGVDEQRVWVVVDIVSPAERWRSLGDGYRVEAQFVLWREPQVLQVPAGALFRHHEGWAVFVLADGQARLRNVRLGRRNGLSAQIQEGLAPGERVILHPGDNVDDGTPVEPR